MTVEIAISLSLGLETDAALLPYILSVSQVTTKLWEPRAQEGALRCLRSIENWGESFRRRAVLPVSQPLQLGFTELPKMTVNGWYQVGNTLVSALEQYSQ